MWVAGSKPAEQETGMNTTITQQLRALQTMAPAQLATHYAELFGKPPRVRNAAWLRRQVAWKIQERELGGLNDRTKTRLDELTTQIALPLGNAAAPPPRPTLRAAPKDPLVGTTLVREWHGQQIRVEVRDNGYVWNGAVYKSLTAAVRAITSSNWNPKIFFGLVQRRAAQ
jgi:hypothetical protein